MLDNLAIISRIRDAHQTLMEHTKLVGDSISDEEAMSSLRGAHSDWIPGRQEILAEKQKKLQRTLGFLDEGLKNHFAFEEEVLPPLLGELFMRALILDHREINRELDEAKSIAADIKLEGLSREELLSRESHLQQVIDSISRQVEDHATREEMILGMLEKALQEK